MIEYSRGYISNSEAKVETLVQSLSDRAKSVAKELSSDFEKSAVVREASAKR